MLLNKETKPPEGSSNQNPLSAITRHLLDNLARAAAYNSTMFSTRWFQAMNFIFRPLKPFWLLNTNLTRVHKNNFINCFFLTIHLDHGNSIRLPTLTLPARCNFLGANLANVLYCDVILSAIELQSSYYIHLGNLWNPLSPFPLGMG